MQERTGDFAKWTNKEGTDIKMHGVKLAKAESGCIKTNPSAMLLEDWVKTNAKNGELPDVSDILWVLKADGRVVVAREIQGDLKNGHPTLAAFGETLKKGQIPKAEFGGEIVKVNGEWTINNKSGRYSNRPDVTVGNLQKIADVFAENGINLRTGFIEMYKPKP